MTRSRSRNLLLVLAVLAGGLLFSQPAEAQHHGHHRANCPNCRPQTNGQPDLFYNFYVPGYCGGVPAQLYVAPRPVPPHVGHTYFTYQPFMPHELLYKHKRSYHRYYHNGRGLTRTHVRWW